MLLIPDTYRSALSAAKNTAAAAVLLCLAAAPAALAQETDDRVLREAFWSAVSSAPLDRRPGVGLALSGGGARGFAHTGVLEVLGYAGFPVDYVSGTSMGAIIGSLYSMGIPVPDIWSFGTDAASLKVSKDFSKVKLLSLLISDKLMTPKYINRFIDSRIGKADFSSLKKPFACVAMDFRTGEKIIFTEGELAPAVKASVNLPGIFSPLEYRHRYLVDGGVVDFIPVDAARQLGAEWVIASVAENATEEMPGNVLTSLLQVIDIRGTLLAKSAEKDADALIKPMVGEIKVADFDRCAEAGEAGVREAMRKIDGVREKYILRSAVDFVEKM